MSGPPFLAQIPENGGGNSPSVARKGILLAKEGTGDLPQTLLGEGTAWFVEEELVGLASDNTAYAYELDARAATRFFHSAGVTSWDALAQQDLLGYEAALGPPVAANTARRRVATLRMMLRFFDRKGVGPRLDPPKGDFRPPQLLPKALARWQIRRIFDTARPLWDPRMFRDRALMELLYGSGLRVTEACELPANPFYERDVLEVYGKGGKLRLVPIRDDTVRWLDFYIHDARPQLASRRCDRLFLSDRGTPLRREQVYRRLERMADASGLGVHISPHILRHSYAVHLLQSGADIRAIQELLGHESIVTTQIYTQLDIEDVMAKYRSAHPRGAKITEGEYLQRRIELEHGA